MPNPMTDPIKAAAPEEWAALCEWTDKCSDRSQNADPGQREDNIIGLQQDIIAKLGEALEERDAAIGIATVGIPDDFYPDNDWTARVQFIVNAWRRQVYYAARDREEAPDA